MICKKFYKWSKMNPDSLDLSFEATPHMLTDMVEDHRAWVSGDSDPSSTIIRLSGTVEAETRTLVEEIQANPLPLLLRKPDDFDIPGWRDVMAQAQRSLVNGLGFSVIDRLPMEEFEDNDMKSVFWIVGQLIGQTVAQKWDGQMVYDVTDTGKNFAYGVRGSHTNVELVFHTDNAFGVAPPDYVGLLCKYPAVSGGISRFCSLYSLHNMMLSEFPDLLKRLYQPMLYDRQAEHLPGAPKTTFAPFFAFDGRKLTARANVQLVRKGYEVAEIDLDSELTDALNAIEMVGNREELWLELPIERGQLQYLNNLELGHYRSNFEDHANPAKKRHLFRTWHRDWGARTYDG